jgi:hypothetical protein
LKILGKGSERDLGILVNFCQIQKANMFSYHPKLFRYNERLLKIEGLMLIGIAQMMYLLDCRSVFAVCEYESHCSDRSM